MKGQTHSLSPLAVSTVWPARPTYFIQHLDPGIPIAHGVCTVNSWLPRIHQRRRAYTKYTCFRLTTAWLSTNISNSYTPPITHRPSCFIHFTALQILPCYNCCCLPKHFCRTKQHNIESLLKFYFSTSNSEIFKSQFHHSALFSFFSRVFAWLESLVLIFLEFFFTPYSFCFAELESEEKLRS